MSSRIVDLKGFNSRVMLTVDLKYIEAVGRGSHDCFYVHHRSGESRKIFTEWITREEFVKLWKDYVYNGI
jgi:hypothetical protein